MRRMLFLIPALVLLVTGSLAPFTAARAADNAQAPLHHTGIPAGDCQGNGVSGFPVVGFVNAHLNQQTNTLLVNIHVEGALPNTTYLASVRCVVIQGTLTTNSHGVGNATIRFAAAPGTFSIGLGAFASDNTLIDDIFSGPITLQ